MTAVSVIVVSWNASGPLRRCLASLPGEAAEVVVVDNASEDDSGAVADSAGPPVRVIREPANRGFAGAVNDGVRASAGEYLLLLNPDAEATPGAIRRLAAELDRRPESAAVAGRLLGDDGSPQRGWNVRRLPTLASLATSLLLVDRIWPSNPIRRRALALDWDDATPGEVEQPAAACLMIRRAVFDRIGGLDERFHPAWFEDVDLCRRLKANGWRIWYAPGAEFRHTGGVARARLGPRAFQWFWHCNLERYVRKHHGAAGAALIKGCVLAGAAARLAACLARGNRRESAAYAALFAGSLTGWRLAAPPAGPAHRPDE